MRLKKLPDNAIVVRGGKSTPSLIGQAIAHFPCGLTGIAVISTPEQTVERLSHTIPHKTIRTTTVATIRSAGGDVISRDGRSPFFAVMVGWQSMYTTNVTDSSSEGESDMSNKQGLRIFADFNNADKLGRVRLNTKGARDDMASLGLTFHEGMNVVLDDREEFVVDAIVRYCPVEGWVAEIDWQALEKR